MKFSEALLGARGHIAWILALTFSTVAIFHLENLSLASQEAAEREAALQTDARLSAEAGAALAEAEARQAASPADPAAAASLLLALSAAVQAGAVEIDPARMRADTLWELAGQAGPAWRPAIVSAALTFAR
jgi:hypothetical protein